MADGWMFTWEHTFGWLKPLQAFVLFDYEYEILDASLFYLLSIQEQESTLSTLLKWYTQTLTVIR